jgi:hypothetical protein
MHEECCAWCNQLLCEEEVHLVPIYRAGLRNRRGKAPDLQSGE